MTTAATGWLIGRAPEVEQLAARLSDARAGRGGLTLVCGPAGIGKTALAAVARTLAREAGMRVLVGRCVDAAGVPPLWPWRPVLPDRPGEQDPGRLPVTADDAAAQRFHTVQRLAATVLQRTSAQPTLLVLEDLQWADPLSLELLGAVAGAAADSTLCVLGTHRDVRPGGEWGLGDVLPRLHGEPAVAVMRLYPLHRDAVTVLLGAALRGVGDPAALITEVLARTSGNPLFTRTVADLLRRLPADQRLPAVVSLAEQPELREVIRRALARLPDRITGLLRVASIVGEEFRGSELAQLTGADAITVITALGAAVDAGAVTVDPDGDRYRFAHALVREGVYADLPAAERRRCHRRVAEWLESAPTAAERAGELAMHWLRGALDDTDLRRASRWAQRAARTAAGQHAWDSAAQLLTTAVDAAVRSRCSPAEIAELLVEAAAANYRASRFPRAVELARRAGDAAETAGRPDLLVAAALAVQGVGRTAANAPALELTERALACAVTPATRARLLAQQASCLMHLDRPARAVQPSRAALELARDSGDAAAELAAVQARQLVLAAPAGWSERIALSDRAGELAELLDTATARLWSTLWQIDTAFETGNIARVDALLGHLAVLTTDTPPAGRWHLHRLRAARYMLAGEFAAARTEAEHARAMARRVGDSGLGNLYVAFRIELAALRGDPTELPDDIDQALARAPDIPVVQVSRAQVALLRGRRRPAETGYAQVMAEAQTMPATGYWLATVLLLVELAEHLDDPAGAAVLYRLLEPAEPHYAAGPAGTLVCKGANALPLARTALVQRRWDTALAHADAARQRNARIGAGPYVALAHLATARALLGRNAPGDTDRADAAAAQAAALAEQLDMPGPLAAAHRLRRSDGRVTPAGLTVREQEIAQLVTRGLTNRQIAAALFLSERTVETHLANTLRKLGLHRRTQLAAHLLTATGDNPAP